MRRRLAGAQLHTDAHAEEADGPAAASARCREGFAREERRVYETGGGGLWFVYKMRRCSCRTGRPSNERSIIGNFDKCVGIVCIRFL